MIQPSPNIHIPINKDHLVWIAYLVIFFGASSVFKGVIGPTNLGLGGQSQISAGLVRENRESPTLLGGSSQLGYVVNNHGDRFCPQDLGLWDPFQTAELHGL